MNWEEIAPTPEAIRALASRHGQYARVSVLCCDLLAIAAALATARREGAEEMRERAARYVDHCRAVVPGIGPVVDAIRALPLDAPREGGEA